MNPDRPPWHADTRVLHDDAALADEASVVAPIHYSATFRARDAAEFADMANRARHPAFYTRYGNPLHERVAAILAGLEGTETALLTGSGMGAISTTVLALVSAGDHVVAQTRHYMSTAKLFDEVLPRFGASATLVEQSDVDAIRAAIRPNTRLIMLETPANPTLVLTDLAAVAALARERGITTVCDNTFASPLNQQPHALGIDIVVHSATKILGGHHDLTAGAICCSKELAEKIWRMHITLGSVLSPMDAWLLLRGLRTLAVRVERINANALTLARWLEAQPQVVRVHYPGLPSHPQHALAKRQQKSGGAIVSFEVRGDRATAWKVVDATRLISITANLGDTKSTITHPASTTHGRISAEARAAAGIRETLLRVAVGLESVPDLQADLARGLALI